MGKTKKLQKQREQRERGGHCDYTTDVVDVDIPMSGRNADSSKQTVPVYDSLCNPFPDPSSHPRKRKPKKLHHTKLEQGWTLYNTGTLQPPLPAMHAVANGEHTESFSTTKKNGAPLEGTGIEETPSETGESTGGFANNESYNGEKTHKHGKPCPKSKKIKERVPSTDRIDRDGVANQSKNNLVIQEEEQEKATRASPEPNPEPMPNICEVDSEQTPEFPEADLELTPDIPETDPEQISNISETEAAISEEETKEPDVVQEPTKEAGNFSSELSEEDIGSDRCHIESTDGLSGSESGNEGIITEPEDRESINISDPDITISFLEGSDEDDPYASCDHESEDVSAENIVEGSHPLIEFPMDSPGKTSKSSHHDDPTDSDMDGSIETDENMPKPDPFQDASDISAETAVKILHPIRNPSHVNDTQIVQEKATDELPNEREYDFSFAKSLRSLSGRGAMKPLPSGSKQADTSLSNKSRSPIFPFSFGKRKAEDLPKEQEPKRVKAEDGVEALGFFARLTSPVMNRLRSIRVGTPAQTGEEVNGHEEMAVALVTPPSTSKRCILM